MKSTPKTKKTQAEKTTIRRLASELASKMAWEAKHGKPSRPEGIILREIQQVYGSLSPENLSCDGELSAAETQRRAVPLQRQLKALFAELGREVSESEAFYT